MFLFIQAISKVSQLLRSFKYISCSYLSEPSEYPSGGFWDLNTSHVLIYLGSSTASPCCQTDLNTSHVLIYHGKLTKILASEVNLNTSHVLIYRCWWGWNVYQSCHLNTSHVLIYLIDSLIKFPSPQFKYISCSYLSICGGNDNPNIFQFKYISCSYLSIASRSALT